jgi:hypothetical protein
VKSRVLLNTFLLVVFIVSVKLNWLRPPDPGRRNIEYFPNMAHSARYAAFSPNPEFPDGKTLQQPEPGAIPRGYRPVHYKPTPEDALRAGEELQNPFAAAPARHLDRGTFVFTNFCQACHGAGVVGGSEGREDEGRPNVPRAHVRAGQYALLRNATLTGGPLERDSLRALAARAGGGASPNTLSGATGIDTLARRATMSAENVKLPEGVARPLKVLIAVGGVTFLAGVFQAPQRVWPDLLMASFFLLGLSLAGTFFVALQYITGAGWSVAFRRIPEAMAALLPMGAVGLGVVLLLHPRLYPWVGTSAVGGEPFRGFKQVWLSLPFFLARSAIYLASWIAFTLAIVRTSRRQDQDGDPSHTHRNVRLSAGFLVVFGVTFTLASFDWIMSLEPRWYSTIFGIYNFAGMFPGGLAALILLLIWVQRLAPAQVVVTDGHLHDLGKLLFAFSTFWAYIWFCQYMLIWYANIPEETSYFVQQVHGAWGAALPPQLAPELGRALPGAPAAKDPAEPQRDGESHDRDSGWKVARPVFDDPAALCGAQTGPGGLGDRPDGRGDRAVRPPAFRRPAQGATGPLERSLLRGKPSLPHMIQLIGCLKRGLPD